MVYTACAWRNKEIARQKGLGIGTSSKMKLKLQRDDFIKGVEQIFKEFNQSEKTARGIEKGFTRLGQNFESPVESKAAFKVYLDAMRDSEVFGDEHFQNLLDENQAGVVALESENIVDWPEDVG